MRKRPLHPLAELTLARLLEFVREPEAIFWVFVFPVIVAVALGIAFRARPPEPFRVAIVGDESQAAQVKALLGNTDVATASWLASERAAVALRTGKVDLVVTVAAGEGTADGTPSPEPRPTSAAGPASGSAPALAAPASAPRLLLRFDPARPESRAARFAVDRALQRGAGQLDRLAIEEQAVAEQGARYIDFLIPGLIGLNIMGSAMWGIGYAVVLARRNRLLKRLAATPMRRSHYLLSFMLSRMVFLVPEVAALVAFGWIVFDVAVRGSVAGVVVVAIFGGLSFTCIALLVAARTASTEVASGWMNAIQLPMWMLSGSFFSYERFPEVAHPFIRLLPLTAFNDALRALVNDGASLSALGPELGVLGGWGLVCFLLALRLFRWH